MLNPGTARDIEDFLTAASTVAVAVFALVTIGLAFWERITNRRRAYDAVWFAANWLDGQHVAMRDNDVARMALDGTLSPDDFLPPDWPGLTTAVSTLGRNSARFAGAALRTANSARNQARILVEASRGQQRQLATLEGFAEHLRPEMETRFGAFASRGVAQIRDQLLEATNQMYDALACGPWWAKREWQPTTWLLDQLKSTLARTLLTERAQAARREDA